MTYINNNINGNHQEKILKQTKHKSKSGTEVKKENKKACLWNVRNVKMPR